MATRVCIVAADGVLDTGLGVTLDVLHGANRIASAGGRRPPFRVELRAPGSRRLTTGCGYRLEVDGALSARLRPDVVVALGLNRPTQEELEAALETPAVRAIAGFLAAQHRRGALICAACSATFIAGEAGILDGGRATTSWWLAPVFRRRYPGVELCDDAALVQGERVVTGGAALSHFDLALWLVRRFAGVETARMCARYLVLDERLSQARYALVDHLRGAGPEVARAEAWIRAHLEGPIAVDDVARAAGTSPRTLARRVRAALGCSPLRLVQRIRAEHAVQLLETTGLSVQAVANRVGYEDEGALRATLRRETGRTPRQLRALA